MRTAILSVVFAAILSAAPQQDPSKRSRTAPSQQKPPDPPLSVLCAPATTIQLGVAYNSAVIASGGTGVYRFAISGALPSGIGLDTTTGTISGTPIVDGTFSYTVQVTDSAGAVANTGSTPCTLQLPPAPNAPAAPARPTSGRTSSGSAVSAAPAPDPVAKTPAETTSVTKPPVLAPPDIDPAAHGDGTAR